MLTPLPRHRLRRRVFRTHRHRPDAVCWCFFFLSGKTRAFCLRTHSLFLSSPPSLPPSLLLGRSLSRQHPLPPASPIRKSERARARVRGAVHAAGARWCVYMPMQRDLLQCQKRPMRTTVTGTHTRILCAAGANSPYIHTHTHTHTHSLTGHGYFVPLAVYLRDDHPESPPGHTHTYTLGDYR